MMSTVNYQVRAARKEDCLTIANLYSLSSDGIADYIWSKLAEPGEDILQVGKRRYEQEDSNFSYRNCQVVEIEGMVVGMLVAFSMYRAEDDESLSGQEQDPVLLPYSKLEEYDSYYVCGVALFPEYQGRGIGKHLMALAEQQCRRAGLSKLSLIVFGQNTGAKRLYDSLGYTVVAAEAVVPHELIHYTGEAYLMVKPLPLT